MSASITIRLNPADNVVIARQQLIAGAILANGGKTTLPAITAK